MAIILTENDLKRLYWTPAGIDDLLKLIEESLRAHSRNEVVGQTIVETSALGPRLKYRIMTAAVPGAGYGMRISALFDGAKDAYFHLLFDNESGDLLAMVAGRELNVWRTGAPAGVASRYLAPANTKTLGILGTGRQARGQLMAIHRSVPSLEGVRVYSPIQAHRIAFVNEMRAWLGVDVEAVSSSREALWDAGIVSIATNFPAPVLDANWISPGALVISLSNGQLPEELVTNSRVIVSWKEEILSAERPRQPYAAKA